MGQNKSSAIPESQRRLQYMKNRADDNDFTRSFFANGDVTNKHGCHYELSKCLGECKQDLSDQEVTICKYYIMCSVKLKYRDWEGDIIGSRCMFWLKITSEKQYPTLPDQVVAIAETLKPRLFRCSDLTKEQLDQFKPVWHNPLFVSFVNQYTRFKIQVPPIANNIELSHTTEEGV
jgi:hypothetical protein